MVNPIFSDIFDGNLLDNNTTNGFDSDDLIVLDNGNDTSNGGAGNDLIYGNGGKDTLVGGAGIDTLNGGDGNDVITSDGDGGTYRGNGGNDTLFSGLGPETMDGGAGTDTIDHTAWGGNYVFNMATGLTDFGSESYINFENANMGAGNDSVTGNASANLINGGAGNDTINGGLGNDTLDGGFGEDSLTGGAGNDFFRLDNIANRDLIAGFSVPADKIILADSLDSILVISPGITGLSFVGGNVPGNVLSVGLLFKGAGFTGGALGNLSGIYVNTINGDIWYNNSTAAGSYLIANVGAGAAAGMTNANFVYGL